eukprot:17879-Eustigmatos_ZCMA.PRE.1
MKHVTVLSAHQGSTRQVDQHAWTITRCRSDYILLDSVSHHWSLRTTNIFVSHHSLLHMADAAVIYLHCSMVDDTHRRRSHTGGSGC